MSHSVLAPSAGGTWAKPGGCLAYPTVVQLYPDLRDDPAAREGTASHEVAEVITPQLIRGETPSWADFEGREASNGVLFTEEMFDCALEFAKYCASFVTGGYWGVETKVDCFAIHPECYGTCDLWWYDAASNTLHVLDYKFGKRYVAVFENYQLVIYMVGVTSSLNLCAASMESLTVVFHIVQPRCYSKEGIAETWHTQATSNTVATMLRSAQQNAKLAMEPNAPRRSGSHCRDCPARFDCEAALSAGMTIYEAATTAGPLNMTNGQLGYQLSLIDEAIDRLTALKTGYEVQAEHLLETGNVVPGYERSPGRGSTYWVHPPEHVATVADLMGVNISTPKVKTPKQAKELGLPPDVVERMSETKSGALKLKRTNSQQIRKYFHD